MDKKQVLKAIADETRMNILKLLLRHNYCVRALANELNLTEATISQHLKVLREAGLLVGEKRGYFMHYDVERSVLKELANEMEALAAIERKPCQPEQRDDCPADEKQGCNKKGKCDDEVKAFCHGIDHGKKDERHGNGACHKS
ncbi:MAG: winged helix-turn-helix transcriptional regulator [Clostridiaceae bacterium]|jgi:ArsR family transcriptional regulator|nr:winged helix-turn-helix transcriptional regulator [Clostridiaceae bacterium]